ADAIPILRRNIFDSETGDLSAPPQVDEVEEEDEDTPPPPTDTWQVGDPIPPACDGSMRLVGAFVRMRRHEDSFAVITDASGQSLLYQEGMSVDDREIVHIAATRVVLRPRGGNHCSLSMFGEQPRVATAPTPTVTAERAPAAASGTTDGIDNAALEAGITQVSEREYTIDRSLVTSLLANQAALMRSARVIP